MSDYLGHLAARSLDPAAAAVQPRLASRFEPLSPWAPPLAAERTEEPALLETSAEEAAPAPARAPRTAAPPRRRMALPEVEEPERIEARRPETLRPAMPVQVPAVLVPVQGNPSDRSGPLFETSRPAPLSTQGERGNGIEPKALAAHTVLAVTRDGAHSAPYDPITPEKISLSTRVERGPGGEASRADRPAERRAMENGMASTVLQPKVTLAERDPFPVRRETPAPAPTIHVSIGRIEVRATPAPKAPVRERQAAPAALSLEDYLKQRSKGGDR